MNIQGITVDLTTLRAEWEARNAGGSVGNALSGHLSGSFGQLGSLNDGSSVSGSGNDANEEIDVVGGLDSCSESGSERMDSAADGSIDGESYPRLIHDHNEQGRMSHPLSEHQASNGSLNLNRDLNHQQGIRQWGLSLLERRRELVNLSNNIVRRSSESSRGLGRVQLNRNDDEVQSGSIDLSFKGREERRRLNPFSIDSLLGNTRSTSSRNDQRPSTPTNLSNGRQSSSVPILVSTPPSTT